MRLKRNAHKRATMGRIYCPAGRNAHSEGIKSGGQKAWTVNKGTEKGTERVSKARSGKSAEKDQRRHGWLRESESRKPARRSNERRISRER